MNHAIAYKQWLGYMYCTRGVATQKMKEVLNILCTPQNLIFGPIGIWKLAWLAVMSVASSYQ